MSNLGDVIRGLDTEELINRSHEEFINSLKSSESEELQRKLDHCREVDEYNADTVDSIQKSVEERYSEGVERYGSVDPLTWFSLDDICRFVEENILEPKEEFEKDIEKVLISIMENEPELTKDYFDFPVEWEECGLAEKIRKLYKVPDCAKDDDALEDSGRK